MVFDRQTGQASVVGRLLLGLGVSDPTRPRLLALYQGQIARVPAQGIAILPDTSDLVPRAISRDGRRMYAIRADVPSGLNVREFVVLDSTTGQLLRTVPLPEVFSEVPLNLKAAFRGIHHCSCDIALKCSASHPKTR